VGWAAEELWCGCLQQQESFFFSKVSKLALWPNPTLLFSKYVQGQLYLMNCMMSSNHIESWKACNCDTCSLQINYNPKKLTLLSQRVLEELQD
jgi:hypothetical protein